MQKKIVLSLLIAIVVLSGCDKGANTSPSVFEYTVETDFTDSIRPGGSWRGNSVQLYQDKASFDLSIKKTTDNLGLPTITVTASNFKNYAPTVTPASQTYTDIYSSFTLKSDWIPDGTGQTNITGVNLVNFGADSLVNLDFVHTAALSPGFILKSSPGNTDTIPATPLGGSRGFPQGVTMKLIRQNQNISVSPLEKITIKTK